jgi:hypothetical protein
MTREVQVSIPSSPLPHPARAQFGLILRGPKNGSGSQSPEFPNWEITRQPSSNGSTGSSHKSRKDVQSQNCLPAEVLNIGSGQDSAGVGACTFHLATNFEDARAKVPCYP